jgi:antitoxin (DNA-binding transcriptional repressor) of toxin-antitoxin stability system
MTREIVLTDDTERLSALVREVAETGAEIVFLRNGSPAARLVGIPRQTRSPEERRDRLQKMVSRADALAAEFPPSADPLTWDDLRRLMREEDNSTADRE